MNPTLAITVDNKKRATAVGIIAVGEKIDITISGITPSDVPEISASDTRKSLRLRIVDALGKDLVRYPVATTDTWTVSSNTFSATSVNLNTEPLLKAFRDIPFRESLEFGIIIDSTVDAAQYATGIFKIRNWAVSSMDDIMVLPDWQTVYAQAMAAISNSVSLASTYANNAEQNAGVAQSAMGSAQGYSTSASISSQQASQYYEAMLLVAVRTPYINGTTGNWMVWNNATQNYVDSGVAAQGVSPAVTTTAITGGHTITITDATHPSGQSFNVMDGVAGSWNDLTDKPSTFPPSTHTHTTLANKPTTGALDADPSFDDVVTKLNTLIAELKG